MPRAGRQPTSASQARTRSQQAPLGHDGADSTDDFLQRFAQDEARRQQPKPTMTAEEHAMFRQRVELAPSIARHWARNTKLNFLVVEKKWTECATSLTCFDLSLGPLMVCNRFCATMGFVDTQKALQRADRSMAMDFLVHMCEKGRITKGDTLRVYFKVWKQRASRSCLPS